MFFPSPGGIFCRVQQNHQTLILDRTSADLPLASLCHFALLMTCLEPVSNVSPLASNGLGSEKIVYHFPPGCYLPGLHNCRGTGGVTL